MTSPALIEKNLRSSLSLYEEILAIVSREGQMLRSGEAICSSDLIEAKTSLLTRLKQSLELLKEYRLSWQSMNAAERAIHPEIAPLLRQSQDLIMKIIVLDRENEQTLLRRGMIPAHQLPSANRQRPHYVAQLYHRGTRNSAD